jgi:hypothetical protein
MPGRHDRFLRPEFIVTKLVISSDDKLDVGKFALDPDINVGVDGLGGHTIDVDKQIHSAQTAQGSL